MGHGMYCSGGMLCDACVTEAKNQSEIDDLRAQLTESQEQLKFYKNQLSTKNKLCDSIEKQDNVVKALLDLEIVHTPSTYLSIGKILLLGKDIVAEVLRKLDVSEANITICSDGDIVLRIPRMGRRFVFRQDAFGDIKLYDSFELYEEEYYEYDE
jgi:hypothetical protein